MSDETFSICEPCLGIDQHIKMIKQLNGAECRSCTRPFTVYRWNTPGANKTLKTIICITCSKAKNCCQSCMMDIKFHIPIDIRDTALKMAGLSNLIGITSSGSTNREVKAIMADKLEQKFKDNENETKENQAREILLKLALRLKDQSFKKAPKTLKEDKSKNADISKILDKLPFGALIVPEKHIDTTTFFIFGVGQEVPQYAVTDEFNKFGKIKTFTLVHRAKCGFVTYATRESAEAFARHVLGNGLNQNKSTAGMMILQGKYPVRVSFGKPKPLGVTNEEHQKLSLVVDKVMKQLADKDQGRDVKKVKTSGAAKEKEVPKEQVLYKAINPDFEV